MKHHEAKRWEDEHVELQKSACNVLSGTCTLASTQQSTQKRVYVNKLMVGIAHKEIELRDVCVYTGVFC